MISIGGEPFAPPGRSHALYSFVAANAGCFEVSLSPLMFLTCDVCVYHGRVLDSCMHIQLDEGFARMTDTMLASQVNHTTNHTAPNPEWGPYHLKPKRGMVHDPAPRHTQPFDQSVARSPNRMSSTARTGESNPPAKRARTQSKEDPTSSSKTKPAVEQEHSPACRCPCAQWSQQHLNMLIETYDVHPAELLQCQCRRCHNISRCRVRCETLLDGGRHCGYCAGKHGVDHAK